MQPAPQFSLEERMEKSVDFYRVRVGSVFLWNGRYYRKIKPLAVGYTRAPRVKYHNCEEAEGGKTLFLYATVAVIPVEFEDIRTEDNGKLLFRYCRECDLIEIKPKGEERPLLVKLD